MEEIRLRDEYIKLGQALKLCGAVQSGVEAKTVIQAGQVRVNGQPELQRGKKLYSGDVIEYQGRSIRIKGHDH